MRLARSTIIGLGIALGLPGAAHAATVEYPAWNGDLVYTAGAGERNEVTLRLENDSYVFTDAAAALEARGGCVNEGAQRVVCPMGGARPTVGVNLEDGDDRLDAAVPTDGTVTRRALYANGGSGADQLTLAAVELSASGGEGPDTISVLDGYMAMVRGDQGDDTLTAGSIWSEVVGGDGNDVLSGADRNDVEKPGRNAAYEYLGGGPGDDRIDGRAGRDRIDGDDGADTVDGGAQEDTVAGGAGNDTLGGGTHGDTIEGGDGDDRIDGGGGDTFRADDLPTFEATRGQFVDRIDGGPGSDTLNGGDGDFDTVTYDRRRASVLASLDGRRNDGEPGERDLIGPDVEHVVGGSGDDVLRGSADPDFLEGAEGDDAIHAGGGYHDVAYGGPGNDTIVALDGGVEGRVGIGLAMAPSFLHDDSVRCDDDPRRAGVDTAIVDPTDAGAGSQLSTGGCETVFMQSAPASVPVHGGAVPAPVTCGGGSGGSCSGQAIVEQYLPARRGRASKRRVLGKANFRARVRKRSRVRVRLNASGRAAARGKRRLGAVRIAYRFKAQRR
jgi:Ca2+-binding RTX toxin-like protein